LGLFLARQTDIGMSAGVSRVREPEWKHSTRVGESSVRPATLSVQSQWGTLDLIAEIADEWRQLCDEGPCRAPFFRPEWISAAIDAFANPQRFLLVTVRDGARLRAVLPLIEVKGRSGALMGTRLRSASLIPRFELIHGDSPEDCIPLIWQHLRNLSGWDVIELVNVPASGAADHLLDSACQEHFPVCRYEYARSPYISLKRQSSSPDFSRFGLSSRFRYHLRQGWRELNKIGAVRLRREEKVNAEALENFYRLEQSGWKGKKGTAIACSPSMRQFYDSVTRSAEGLGYLSMYFLDLNDKPIAAHLAFSYAGHYYPVKVAYDEAFSVYGPGHLLIAQVLQDCVERGFCEFDCLGDWTEAKAKWTEQVRPHSYGAIFRKTTIGQLRRAGTSWAHQLDAELRRVLSPVVHSARSYLAKRRRRYSKRAEQRDSQQDSNK